MRLCVVMTALDVNKRSFIGAPEPITELRQSPSQCHSQTRQWSCRLWLSEKGRNRSGKVWEKSELVWMCSIMGCCRCWQVLLVVLVDCAALRIYHQSPSRGTYLVCFPRSYRNRPLLRAIGSSLRDAALIGPQATTYSGRFRVYPPWSR